MNPGEPRLAHELRIYTVLGTKYREHVLSDELLSASRQAGASVSGRDGKVGGAGCIYPEKHEKVLTDVLSLTLLRGRALLLIALPQWLRKLTQHRT